MARPFLSSLLVACSGALIACGGSPPAKSASAEPGLKTRSSVVKSEPEPTKEDIPSRCINRKGACMPPIKWAEKLCEDVYEDLAMYMFQRGSPWTRFYMRTGLNAVNGWGPTIDEDLLSQEELLVLNHRLRRDSLIVEGSEGTYDALRWNGSCVKLNEEEVTSLAPWQKIAAPIPWNYLDDNLQAVLLQEPKIQSAQHDWRTQCKGSRMGSKSAACERSEKQLSDLIATHVRGGARLPDPELLP